MPTSSILETIESSLDIKPTAVAVIKGNSLAPDLTLTMLFYPIKNGTLAFIEAYGLPNYHRNNSEFRSGPFAINIYPEDECKDIPEVESQTSSNQVPPQRPKVNIGFPIIFSNNGYAFSSIYSDEFSPGEILGKSVVIQEVSLNDSGLEIKNEGIKIGCSTIKRL